MEFDPKIGKWNINPLISTPGTRGSGELVLPVVSGQFPSQTISLPSF